jgi:hypothetical protein
MQAVSLVFQGIDGKVITDAIGSDRIDSVIEIAKRASKSGVANVNGKDIKVRAGIVQASWQLIPAYQFNIADAELRPEPMLTAGDRPRKIVK